MSVLVCFATWVLISLVSRSCAEACTEAIGMHAELSSVGTAASTKAEDARYNANSSWCVPSDTKASSTYFDSSKYLHINFNRVFTITAIRLQSGFGALAQYSYGKKIQLRYQGPVTTNPLIVYKTSEGKEEILTSGPSNEILVNLNPTIRAQYVFLYPGIDQNPKCLRFELYGCPFIEPTPAPVCASSEKILVPSVVPYRNINQSSSLSNTDNSVLYTGKFIFFDEPFAWCPNTKAYSSVPSNKYIQWIHVNLGKIYYLTAIQLKGFVPGGTSLASSYRIEYSNNGRDWTPYTNAFGYQEFLGGSAALNKTALNPPITALFIILRPFTKDQNTVCLKVQLFGCPDSSAPFTLPTTATSPTVSLNPVPILTYEAYPGSQKGRFDLSDTKYNGVLLNGVYSNGRGSLTDRNLSKIGPILNRPDWVGWLKSKIAEPFILVQFPMKRRTVGALLSTFTDEATDMTVFRSVIVKSGDDKSNLEGLTSRCDASKDEEKATDGYHVVALSWSKTVSSFIKFTFTYEKNWIVLSEVRLYESYKPVTDDSKAIVRSCIVAGANGGGADGSGSSIGIIIAVVIILLLLALVAFFAYRHRYTIAKFAGRNTEKGSPTTREDFGLLTSPTKESIVSTPTLPIQETPDGKTLNEATSKENVYTFVEDSEYAAPDIVKSTEPSPYTGVIVVDNYEDPNAVTPKLKQKEDDIQFNPIYEGTYENPYKFVSGSSLYADPENTDGLQKTMPYTTFDRSRLSFKELIGTGQFGEVHICEVAGMASELNGVVEPNGDDHAHFKVAVKMLKSDMEHGVQQEFMKEVRVMARLKHDNVVQLLGVCEDEPKCMVVEYMENGDLNQYLQGFTLQQGPVDEQGGTTLALETLFYMAMQITAGMQYLTSQGFVHRDLATRNCLVGAEFTVKISDFGMSRYLYSKHYYRIEGKAVLPIRWMAPESLFYGRFTSQTDVWSFGVTLWEILTFAHNAPYPLLTDQEVIDNACHILQERYGRSRYLTRPDCCPDDIYLAMTRCWSKRQDERPTFTELNKLLKQKIATAEAKA